MKDKIGDRMKGYYEDRNRTYLTRRVPVVLRIDGREFWTEDLNSPLLIGADRNIVDSRISVSEEE